MTEDIKPQPPEPGAPPCETCGGDGKITSTIDCADCLGTGHGEPEGDESDDAPIKSHDPITDELHGYDLRWVHAGNEWQLCAPHLASVWSNGTWHTWDAVGTGGENSSEVSVWFAKRAAENALVRQERKPVKGWAVRGFLDEEPTPDEPAERCSCLGMDPECPNQECQTERSRDRILGRAQPVAEVSGEAVAGRITDTMIDGAIAVLREWRNDGADGESAHLVCDAVLKLRATCERLHEKLTKMRRERDKALRDLTEANVHRKNLLERRNHLERHVADINEIRRERTSTCVALRDELAELTAKLANAEKKAFDGWAHAGQVQKERDAALAEGDSLRARWHDLERIQDRQLTFEQVQIELTEERQRAEKAETERDAALTRVRELEEEPCPNNGTRTRAEAAERDLAEERKRREAAEGESERNRKGCVRLCLLLAPAANPCRHESWVDAAERIGKERLQELDAAREKLEEANMLQAESERCAAERDSLKTALDTWHNDLADAREKLASCRAQSASLIDQRDRALSKLKRARRIVGQWMDKNGPSYYAHILFAVIGRGPTDD